MTYYFPMYISRLFPCIDVGLAVLCSDSDMNLTNKSFINDRPIHDKNKKMMPH